MYKIVPAVLEYDDTSMQQRIATALSFPAPIIHVDIIDSSFSEKTTLPKPELFTPFTSKAFFEAHIMTVNPVQYVEVFAQVGFRRFIGHVEHMTSAPEFIQKTLSLKREAFLGVDFNTTIESMPLTTYATLGLTGLTIMTIHAGLAGQQFQMDALHKVHNVRKQLPQFILEVDGAMNDHTTPLAKEAGANLFAVNSYLFKAKDPKATYHVLQSSLAS